MKSYLTAWCNQILSNREFTQSFQIFSTFAIADPTHEKLKNLDPTRPDPTHGSTQPKDNPAWPICDETVLSCWIASGRVNWVTVIVGVSLPTTESSQLGDESEGPRCNQLTVCQPVSARSFRYYISMYNNNNNNRG